MIGDNRHFLFVNIMTTAELSSLRDADGAISKQAHNQFLLSIDMQIC